MKKNKLLKKTLEKILEKKAAEPQEFEIGLEKDLKVFKEGDDLESLDVGDREVLAKLFIKLGENQLKGEDRKFLESFHSAAKIAPDNYSVYYLQGKAYLKHSNNLQCLSLARKAFEKALEIDAKSFDALFELGNVLVQQGLNLEEARFFQEAIHCFEQAKVMMTGQEENRVVFYWQFGRAWYYLGKLSGEAIDFHNAIENYRHVCSAGIESSFFWNDYGDAIIEMAFLVGKKEYFFEAIDHYTYATLLDKNHFQGYFNLACAYQCVFEMTVDAEYFEKAHECFEMAAQIESHGDQRSAPLWLRWGQLLSIFGKFKRDISYLESSLEKFTLADSIEPNHPGILSRWGEAEMLLGANTDDINLLRGAEEKLVRSLEINSDAPEIWYLYGISLNELGRYFADENFYKLAIQKFQYGLSLTQSDPLLWYGLAMSHFAIGDMLNDKDMIEKATRYSAQVLEFGGQVFLQFWNDWAVMLMRLAEMTLDEKYLESALDKFEQILKRQNGSENQEMSQDLDQELDLEWLYNYGCALDMLGDFTDDLLHYEQAVQVLSNVVKLDPEYIHARYNLALALAHYGESAAEVEPLQKASEHFQIIVHENPEDDMAWNDWGLTLLHQAELIEDSSCPSASHEATHELYKQAEINFTHALSLGCLPAYYNLACLYAMTGQFKTAMYYMERAEKSDSLPAADDILHDEWLGNLRTTDAFKAFIKALEKKEKK